MCVLQRDAIHTKTVKKVWLTKIYWLWKFMNKLLWLWKFGSLLSASTSFTSRVKVTFYCFPSWFFISQKHTTTFDGKSLHVSHDKSNKWVNVPKLRQSNLMIYSGDEFPHFFDDEILYLSLNKCRTFLCSFLFH